MSQEPKQNPVAGLGRAEAKTPLERARQIQELQRQAEQPLNTQPAANPAKPTHVQHTEKSAPIAMKQAAEVFEPKAAEPVAVISEPLKQGADQLGYGATQVEDAKLFGLGSGTAPEVTGNPWKIIKFGDPPERQLAPILDLKQPLAEYAFTVPPKSVKLKQGHLFEIGVGLKSGAEALKRQAVIVDARGVLKGAEFKSVKSLEQGLKGLPGFALGLFQSVFGDGLGKDDPERMQILKVGPGKKSAFEAVLQYRNPVDGKKNERTVTLNNFGMKVPESTDPRRHDIVTRMYRLDSFEAAPPA
ncbi:MAG: hypothetical protein JNK82_01335 [Myxococcaceae bacterium]|nr:hypothetical protein [Myxococcaceae bacterium]